MKVTLVFDPTEDADELYSAMHGWQFRAVLYSFDCWLKDLIKHGDKPQREADILQAIRDELLVLLTERDLDIT